MDYRRIYEQLIVSRRSFKRTKNNDGLFERHHIIPKSLGGNDDRNNLVLLTPREHFIAHWLLYKMYNGTDKAKMAYAFFRMCSNNSNQKREFNSRKYELAKKYMSEACSGENHPNFGKTIWDEEQRQEISKRQTGEGNSMYGKVPWNKGITGNFTHSNESKRKMSESHKGKIKSEEHRKKLSEAHSGKTLSDETKEKLRQANLGKKVSKESIEKTAAKLRGRKQKIITCPHCGKSGGTTMYRWHFDKCKEK